MKTIKTGGVPEHFNLPWHQCIEEKLFEKEEINLEWKDFPEGTGAMCQALRSGELDVAVILTEGIVKDIANGNPSKIIQEYIGSPLIWGIHVAANSAYKDLKDLEGKKAAISRFGSGSHLMAYVNAQRNHWDLEKLDFEIVHTMEGAVKALKNDKAQYFMWEHFTTKPLVDNRTFRLISDCPTPWPCFVIAAREDILEKEPQTIEKMLKVLNSKTKDFKMQKNVDIELSERYQQKLEDIRKWLDLTRWSQNQIANAEIEEVVNQLLLLNILERKVPAEKLLHSF